MANVPQTPSNDDILDYLDRFLRIDVLLDPDHLRFLYDNKDTIPPVDVVLTDFEEALTKIINGKVDRDYLGLWSGFISHNPQIFHFDPAPLRIAKEKRLFENEFANDVLLALQDDDARNELSLPDLLQEFKNLHKTQKTPFPDMALGHFGKRTYVNLYYLGLLPRSPEEDLFFRSVMNELIAAGEEHAFFIYAALHEKGEIYDQDLAIAESFYVLATRSHDSEPLIGLGDFYRKSAPEKAFAAYVKAALTGDETGICRLADCLTEGRGVEKDVSFARALLQHTQEKDALEFIRSDEKGSVLAELSFRLARIADMPGETHLPEDALHYYILARFLWRREAVLSHTPADEAMLSMITERIDALLSAKGKPKSTTNRVRISSLKEFFDTFPGNTFTIARITTNERTLSLTCEADEHHSFLFIVENGGYATYEPAFTLLFHHPMIVSPPFDAEDHPVFHTVRVNDTLRIVQFIGSSGAVILALQYRAVDLIKDPKWKEFNR